MPSPCFSPWDDEIWKGNEEKVKEKLFFYLKLIKKKKILCIVLELAFSLLLRWVLGFKDNSIIRTRTTCPYNRAGTVLPVLTKVKQKMNVWFLFSDLKIFLLLLYNCISNKNHSLRLMSLHFWWKSTSFSSFISERTNWIWNVNNNSNVIAFFDEGDMAFSQRWSNKIGIFRML